MAEISFVSVGALVFIGFAIGSLFIDPYEENHHVPDVEVRFTKHNFIDQTINIYNVRVMTTTRQSSDKTASSSSQQLSTACNLELKSQQTKK